MKKEKISINFWDEFRKLDKKFGTEKLKLCKKHLYNKNIEINEILRKFNLKEVEINVPS